MAKPVEENYIILITIKGTMEQNGENDTVELMTRGNFVQNGNSYYIAYKETEDHRLRRLHHHGRIAEDGSRVVLLRFGKTTSQLIIERASATCAITRRGTAPSPGRDRRRDRVQPADREGRRAAFSYLLDADDARYQSAATAGNDGTARQLTSHFFACGSFGKRRLRTQTERN